MSAVQSALMFSGFLVFENAPICCGVQFWVLIQLNVVLKYCESPLENAVDSKSLYINLKQSFEILHACQELQLCKMQSIKVYKRS